jgi:hypothetical protein
MENGYNEMNNGSFFNLESRLANAIRPVRPDPAFIEGLKQKLAKAPSIVLEKSRKNFGLLALGIGLFTGALMLWIIKKLKS